MRTGYVVVEGHGETAAVSNLLHRLGAELGVSPVRWRSPIRQSGLHVEGKIRSIVEIVRARGDADCMLVIRDSDDDCPREVGPRVAEWLRSAGAAFPIAFVLAEREFESLFLASLPSIAGKPIRDPSGAIRPGLSADARLERDPWTIRGAKEWLSRWMPPGRRYKPSVDQLPLTQMVDFAEVRKSSLRWFGTLERALQFLAEAEPGLVYPPLGARTEER